MESSNKSRAAAAILAFLFGMFGVHRFYVGKIGTGILQLILTFTFIFTWISAIWVLVDFILILCGIFQDKEGKKIEKWG